MKFSWHQKFILISCGIVSLMAIASPVNEFVGAPEGFGSRYVPHEGNAESVTVNERKHKDSSTLIREMQERGFLSRSFDQWFVAANGSANGTGNADSPIDIITAFGGEASRRKIKPGDIVWLRGGSYVGTFQIDLRGTPAAPIHIREYPGERAVFDKGRADRKTGALEVRSSNVWFWDFEVANSLQDRTPTDVNGKINPVRGSGINVWKAGNKFINLIIHDNGHGIGLWNEEGDTEIYGCLIFNNGNNKKEHGIYGNNKTGTQLISNNIIFNNAGYGLHLYADTTSYSLEGFDVIENAIFNNGAITPEDQVADQILVGGVRNVPADRIVIRGNSVFNEPDSLTSKNRGIRLGYEDENNGSVKINSNNHGILSIKG